MPDQLGNEQVKVEFNEDGHGYQTSVYQWLISIGCGPSEWKVYRGQTQLNTWEPVTRGEIVTVRLAGKK